MSESRVEKRKVEFIESYWTGGVHGSDYIWNDNHGELIRCKDCKRHYNELKCRCGGYTPDDWFCADGERKMS